VRCIGIIGVFVALLAVPASAANEKKPCIGLVQETGRIEDPTAQAKQPLMTANECEAVKRHQLQMHLLEIPQEDEDPMGLSVGSKDKGGMFYFKIPFSF
jgi:hypothetical protein